MSTGGRISNFINTPMGAVLVSQTVPLAAMAVVGGTAKAIDAIQGARQYKAMLELHPELKEKDPQVVKRVYGAIRSANPGMMKDPVIAGTLVQRAFDVTGGFRKGDQDAYSGATTTALEMAGIRQPGSRGFSGQLADHAVKATEPLTKAWLESRRDKGLSDPHIRDLMAQYPDVPAGALLGVLPDNRTLDQAEMSPDRIKKRVQEVTQLRMENQGLRKRMDRSIERGLARNKNLREDLAAGVMAGIDQARGQGRGSSFRSAGMAGFGPVKPRQ